MKILPGGKLILCILTLACLGSTFPPKTTIAPNVILVMADDLGWGDVGFNGNTIIKTPELDQMASESIQFTRFYSASPVCSPTRGSILTGRNAERFGIYAANIGHLPAQELTLADVLKTKGYTTGHFGKWHLGTLSKTVQDGGRGGMESEAVHYSPPWENGFDVCFSTELAMPTWDPMVRQYKKSGYWTGPGKTATENLDGDDSRVIVDRVIPFIEKAVRNKKPFLSVVWFHTPHEPVVAGPEYRKIYADLDSNKQHYYGSITAMDQQIGRLRKELRRLGVADNTIVIFCSDNGPAGEGGGSLQYPGKRQQGSAGLFRGRKGSLYEGGIRVPALIEWPTRISAHQKAHFAVSASDLYPTILEWAGVKPDRQILPMDGINIWPKILAHAKVRGIPIGFRFNKQRAFTDDRFKIYSSDEGLHYEMYDLLNDPFETKDISTAQPSQLNAMKTRLDQWILSCRDSEKGKDYIP